MNFSGDIEHFESPHSLFQGFAGVPVCHQQVIRFSNLKFSFYDAQTDGVVHLLATVAPGRKTDKAAVYKGPKESN